MSTIPYYEQDSLTRAQLKKDSTFLDDASLYLLERTGQSLSDPDEIVDELAEVFRWSEMNEISLMRNLTHVRRASDEAGARMGKMILTFQKTDDLTGTGEKITDYFLGAASAPSTIGTVLTAGMGSLAKGALKGGMTLTAQLIKQIALDKLKNVTTKQALIQGGKRGAAIEGSLGAFRGGVREATQQETGLAQFQRDDPALAIARSAGIEGGLGVAIGAPLGAGLRLRTLRKEQKVAELFGEGLRAQERKAKEVVEKNLFNVYLKHLPTSTSKKEARLIARSVTNALSPLKAEATEAGDVLKEKLGQQMSVGPEFALRFADDVHKNLIDAATEIIHKAGLTNFSSKTRITEVLANAFTIHKGKVAQEAADAGVVPAEVNVFAAIDDILIKYGLTREQFSQIVMADVSAAGKLLQKYGQAKKDLFLRLSTAVDNVTANDFIDPAATNRFSALSTALKKGQIRVFTGITALDKARLGLMTIQTATTIRNTVNAGARTALYAMDNLFYGAMDGFNIQRMSVGFKAAGSLLNPAEANMLRLLYAKEMPESFQNLYRQMADIEAGSLSDSKMIGVVRYLNRLNTLADNSFKRAIFMAELQARVGTKALRKHMQEGTFSSIDPEHLSKSMEEALHFTYQRSFAKQGKGFWNASANKFISAFSRPGMSLVIPFPRFIANSIEFMYKHAPLVGLSDFPALIMRRGAGTLQKGEIRKRLGQQLTGAAMLYGAIQLRAQQGPTAKWWELYDEDTGEYKNALAFYGPFAPWMLAADVIVRSYMGDKKTDLTVGGVLHAPFRVLGEETRQKWDDIPKTTLPDELFTEDRGLEFLQAAFGTQFRTGFGGDVLKGYLDKFKYTDLVTPEGKAVTTYEKTRDTFSRESAEFAGNILNSFLVPLGQVRDVYAAFDPKDYEGMLQTDSINPVELFIRKTLRSAPINSDGEYFGIRGFSSKDVAELVGAEGTTAEAVVRPTEATFQESPRRTKGLLRQVTGLSSPKTKNPYEQELEKYRIKGWEIFSKVRNDPELTSIIYNYYQEIVERKLLPYVLSPEYKNMDSRLKGATLKSKTRNELDNVLQIVQKTLRQELKDKDMGLDERALVENRLLRAQQLVFDSYPEVSRLKAVETFFKKFGERPDFDNPEHIRKLEVLARDVTKDVRKGRGKQ